MDPFICPTCNEEVCPRDWRQKHCQKERCRRQRTSFSSRKRLKALLRNSLCDRCSVGTSEPGKRSCAPCLAAHANKALNSRRRKSASGLCAICGKDPQVKSMKRYSLNGSQLSYCKECYLKETSSRHLGSRSNFFLLQRLWDEQCGLCAYTGEALVLGVNASVDHKIPIAKGGTAGIRNLQWVLESVNKMKQSLDEGEFLRICSLIAAHRSR